MNSSSAAESSAPFNAMVLSGGVTVLLASLLAYALRQSQSKKNESSEPEDSATDSTAKVLSQIDPAQYPGGVLSVYYGTQTGTSESFARVLEREGPNHGFFVHVVDLEDVTDMETMKQPYAGKETARAVVLSATYGEGEAPDNATVFVQRLCEKASTEILFDKTSNAQDPAEPSCLEGVDYCVFGLGNKQYDHYNAMGKFFDHALERLGATRVLPPGTGDDDDDLENDFETWKENQFWPAMKKKYIKAGTVLQKAKKKTMPDCSYVIHYHDDHPKPMMDIPTDQIHSHSRHYFTAVECPVTAVRELRNTQEDRGSTVHVEIDISKANDLNYTTADNLGVLPVNDPKIVQAVAESLKLDLNQIFSLKPAPNHEWHGAPFPMPISVKDCLTHYCDLTIAPRRSELKLLAAYATDPMDQKALLRMSSKEGRVEYREKILDQYLGLAEILKLCPSVQMPLEHFLDFIPLLQTRFFTISSSSSVHPDSVHLTVAVNSAKRQDGTTFEGVCSNYLKSRKPALDTIRVFNRPSTFRLPTDAATPIVLIGPGTGVAPMRALLQERRYQRDVQKQPVGPNILYFGCKKPTQDYLYREEFEEMQQQGVLTTLRLAFSRETSTKVYVQHLLEKEADETWALMDQQAAYFYVCGGVKMGQDVSDTLQSIIMSRGNMSREQAKAYLDKMSSQGRYVQELWA